MQLSSPVSRRYAAALVEASESRGQAALDRIAKELTLFAESVQSSPDLKNVLLNPIFTKVERSKVLDAVVKKLALSPMVTRFIELVIQKDRTAEIEAMARSVSEMVDTRAKRLRASVESAAPLSEVEKIGLRRALEKRTGRSIELEVKVDPTLLGGVRAQIGSTVLDGTLRAQLDQLRETLSRS